MSLLRVRCVLCKDIIACRSDEKGILLEHVNQKHPNVEIRRLSDRKIDSTQRRNKTGVSMTTTKDPIKDERISDSASLSLYEKPLADIAPLSKPITKSAAPTTKRFSTTRDANIEASSAEKTTDFRSSFVPGVSNGLPNRKNHLQKTSNESLIRDYLEKCQEAQRRPWPAAESPYCCPPDAPAARDSPQTKEDKPKKKSYRTAIESWRPGNSEVICPRCGRTSLPTVRREASRSAHSRFGAVCMMTFWPFCFMPCIFTAPAVEFVHCGRCGTRLGQYDATTGRTTSVTVVEQTRIMAGHDQGDENKVTTANGVNNSVAEERRKSVKSMVTMK